MKSPIRRIERINREIKTRGRVSEVKMYHWTPPAAIVDSDSETESNENDEHEMAIIDVSRFSVESEPENIINPTLDATLEDSPGDIVVNLPEIIADNEPGPSGINNDQVKAEEPLDIVDELAANLDEIGLGNCFPIYYVNVVDSIKLAK